MITEGSSCSIDPDDDEERALHQRRHHHHHDDAAVVVVVVVLDEVSPVSPRSWSRSRWWWCLSPLLCQCCEVELEEEELQVPGRWRRISPPTPRRRILIRCDSHRNLKRRTSSKTARKKEEEEEEKKSASPALLFLQSRIDEVVDDYCCY